MKKILFFLLVLASFTLSAQNAQMWELMHNTQPSRNVTDVPAENIQFWVGSGSNEVVAAFFFCADPAVGIAYGYRFDGTATILDMWSAINAADPNFTFTYSGSSVTGCEYNNGTVICPNVYGNLIYTVNGVWAGGLSDPLADGDYFEMCEWGDCTLPVTNIYYPVDPSTPTAVDATISADNIIYWVGNGENEVVFVVNFCTPEEEALAWGVRFSGESAIVSDIFHTIELYDERFNVEGTSFVTNITFADGIHDNYTTSMYWMYNVNGVTAANYADQQEVHNGDVIKFGDAECGIITDPVMYTYIWTTPVAPVELPAASTEVFDGIVGTEGCQAIKYDDAAILGWATTCEVTRGYQNIANGEGSALASYGTDNDGVGPSSESTGEGVVSLGDAGYAVLTFGMPISNGEGYDFAVFENSLNHTFLELAFVEVSSDGEHYYRFPSVSNTQTEQQISNGGALDATKINNLAGKYIVGWGTPFDLEELDGYSNLDINNVTHVRIVDVVGSINPLYGTTDKNGHLINDPYPTPWNTSGFDLSGVAVMNGWTPTAVNNYQQEISFMAYPNPCQNVLNVNNVTVNEPVSLFNAMGQQIWNGMTQDTYFQLDMQSYPAGMYMLQIGTQMTKIIKK
ncbi:MAG: T9SS type A sorting domain-containing protein [Bacteroidales bacterium]|nr:T9SS type A sorting domain-containing protein [Bacteroidales bacterium]